MVHVDKQVDVSGTGDLTLHTVSTNRIFYLKSLQIFNDEGSATRYTLYDGSSASGTKKLQVNVAADVSTDPLNFDEPLEFKTSVVVVASQHSTGGSVTISGIEK